MFIERPYVSHRRVLVSVTSESDTLFVEDGGADGMSLRIRFHYENRRTGTIKFKILVSLLEIVVHNKFRVPTKIYLNLPGSSFRRKEDLYVTTSLGTNSFLQNRISL